MHPVVGRRKSKRNAPEPPRGKEPEMKEVKKSPAKKAAPKAAAEKKTVAKAAPVAPKASAAKKPEVTPEQRYKMVQDAAYFIAERHGFNGDSAYFWSLAEAEVSARLN